VVIVILAEGRGNIGRACLYARKKTDAHQYDDKQRDIPAERPYDFNQSVFKQQPESPHNLFGFFRVLIAGNVCHGSVFDVYDFIRNIRQDGIVCD
jgi:hypothetical protein